MTVNIVGLAKADIKNTSSKYVFGGGAFLYSNSDSITFERCEASRTQNSTNGDGFNGHATKTGDAFAKTCTVHILDCWSHDNNDDGYSDHERAESVVRGGLFEYNKKGGITPSYGSHCCCYGVVSRFNYSGFYYTGSIAEDEGGKYGQMQCINCLASNNNSGGIKAGFAVGGNYNKAILINCISENNDTGFYSIGDSNNIEIHMCYSFNDINIKGGNGQFIINNGNLVE